MGAASNAGSREAKERRKQRSWALVGFTVAYFLRARGAGLTNNQVLGRCASLAFGGCAAVRIAGGAFVCPFRSSNLTTCINFSLAKGRHKPPDSFQTRVATCVGVELIDSASFFAFAGNFLCLRLCSLALFVFFDMLQTQRLIDVGPRCYVP